VADRIDRECNPPFAAASPNVGAWVQHPDVKELLQLFLEQECPIRSILVAYPQLFRELSPHGQIAAVGGGHNTAFLLQLLADKHARSSSIIAPVPLQASSDGPSGVHRRTCENLAQQVRQLLSDAPGNDLLLWPVHLLNEMMSLRSDQSPHYRRQNPAARMKMICRNYVMGCLTAALSALVPSRWRAARRSVF